MAALESVAKPQGAPSEASKETMKIQLKGLSLWYGPRQVLKDITLDIQARSITAIIGPSGCGKSSLLRCLNRMNDLIPNARVEGEVLLDGVNIYAPEVDVVALRQRVGMVFQKPNPFPKSVFDNVAYGPRLLGIRNRKVLEEIVERSLREAALWDEVKDMLRQNALTLSGGQQQRLCIARALAMEPEVLLLDEPCSALDPIATLMIEEVLVELKAQLTIVLVTHNMFQASRIGDTTAFLLHGELVEFGPTREFFEHPQDRRTEDFISGRFG